MAGGKLEAQREIDAEMRTERRWEMTPAVDVAIDERPWKTYGRGSA
jgi:hypothetical protein